MYPLLKRDGLSIPTIALTLFWNFALGYNPFALASSFVKYLSTTSYVAVLLLLLLDTLTLPPAHLPDLFVVLNLVLSCGVFGLGWLWSLTRLVEEAWGLVGLGGEAEQGLRSTDRYARPPGTWNERVKSSANESVTEMRHSNGTSNPSDLARPDNNTNDGFQRRNDRSVSATSSSQSAIRPQMTSPLVPPLDLAEDMLLPPGAPGNGLHVHSRSSSSSSVGRERAQINLRMRFPQQGIMSTHVSPSKTVFAEDINGQIAIAGSST